MERIFYLTSSLSMTAIHWNNKVFCQCLAAKCITKESAHSWCVGVQENKGRCNASVGSSNWYHSPSSGWSFITNRKIVLEDFIWICIRASAKQIVFKVTQAVHRRLYSLLARKHGSEGWQVKKKVCKCVEVVQSLLFYECAPVNFL